MITAPPTIDQVLDLAHQLPRAQRAELIAQLAHELVEPPAEAAPAPGSARALLAHAGSWAGDDLPERLAEVYATRQPVEP